MSKEDRTLKELIGGIIVYGVIVQIICLIAGGFRMQIAVGLWLGIFSAAAIAVHMKRSIEDSLELGEGGAQKHMHRKYVVRSLLVAVVFGIAIYTGVGNGLAILAGVMGLKVSAYLQPVIHKIAVKNMK